MDQSQQISATRRAVFGLVVSSAASVTVEQDGRSATSVAVFGTDGGYGHVFYLAPADPGLPIRRLVAYNTAGVRVASIERDPGEERAILGL